MDAVQPLIAAVWVLFVPGLPLALLLTRRYSAIILALAVAPAISVITNLAILLALNLAGWYPDMRLYGAVLTIVAIASTVWMLRSLPERKRILGVLAPAAGVGLVALVIWRYAYSGYLLQAPNQDGMNHNFWVRRIADTGSALWPDFRVLSPLIPVGRIPVTLDALASSADYAQGWHASVAVGAAFVGSDYAAAALLSMVLFWSLGMTLGLMALVRYWVPAYRHLGVLAGLVAQFLPQVPGVPMTWGAIPSVVGVALLPAAFASWIFAFRMSGLVPKITALIVFLGVLFVHPPEAATLLVVGGLMVGVDALHMRRPIGLVVPVAAGLVFTAGYLVLSRGKPDLFMILAEQKGRYEFRPAIEKFTSMSVQTCTNALNPATCDRDLFVAGALLVGIGLSLIARERLTMLAGLGLTGLIYMASAAPDPFFPAVRVYTFPWYTSYERTAWVAAPLIALFIAFGIYWLVVRSQRYPRPLAVACVGLGVLLAVLFVVRSAQPTVTQLRAGPDEGQVARPGSIEVFRAAREAADANGGIIVSPPFDAGVYASVYAGVPVTNGFTGPDGTDVVELQALLQDPASICTNPDVAEAVQRDRVAGLLLADTGIAWSGQIRRREDIAALRGWTLVAEGGGVFLLRPDPSAC